MGVSKHFSKNYVKQNRPAVEKKRYHGKDFQKTFNKADRRQKLKDMSRYLKPFWEYQSRAKIQFVYDFIEVDDIQDGDEDTGDFKHHEIQMKVGKNLENVLYSSYLKR